jgi:hypothetical protein
MKSESKTRSEFSLTVDAAARDLVRVDHRKDGSYVVVPSLYPSGSSALVKVTQSGNGFAVSDFSFAYHEAEQAGGANIFFRHAKTIAERYGIGFDGVSFAVDGVDAGQLPAAIGAVSSASVEAATFVDYRLADQKLVDASIRLYERLVSLFTMEAVKRDVRMVGASATAWNFAASVATSSKRVVTLFEPVTNHHTSVAHATMKFRDIGLLENPPGRVSVVRNKKAFGTYLGVLTQTSSVIEDTVSNAALLRLAA